MPTYACLNMHQGARGINDSMMRVCQSHEHSKLADCSQTTGDCDCSTLYICSKISLHLTVVETNWNQPSASMGNARWQGPLALAWKGPQCFFSHGCLFLWQDTQLSAKSRHDLQLFMSVEMTSIGLSNSKAKRAPGSVTMDVVVLLAAISAFSRHHRDCCRHTLSDKAEDSAGHPAQVIRHVNYAFVERFLPSTHPCNLYQKSQTVIGIGST